MPHQIQFAVDYEGYPPELALAAGYVVLEWTLIEESLTKLLGHFHLHDPNRQSLPAAFERQADILAEYVHKLYGDGPEYAEFQRLFGEIKTIKRKRDSVAHGLAATCTYRGKTFPALWVPNWTSTKQTRHLPATAQTLKALAERASVFKQEWFWAERAISWAFLRPIQEAQQHPSMRGKYVLPEIESLLKNPLRNPKPTKAPRPFPSPLRWPSDMTDWQSASPYKAPSGTVLQKVTAVLLENVQLAPQPPASKP